MAHVIGTAGHIDHGKTALIRALTGQETDRLKEEQERGISIDLGFAYLPLPSGERAGIVDVPGHERFIRNMLAGAHGIDLVLLVVAADDGVMPQTEEHLDILHLLGATHGVVAISKTDLVEPARVAAVRNEIEILLAGTGLEGSPVVPVSSVTGAGLTLLRETIEHQLAGYVRTPRAGPFRLPVDRTFVMHGHGVVVTGTAIAGAVHAGDSVRILPGGATARVRSVQVHGEEVPEAIYGQRVALNLSGVERAHVARGMVVGDPLLDRTTERFDAWVEMRPAASRPLKSHEGVRVYAGTAEVIGKLVLLDGRNALAPRQSAFAQLVLREPVHLLRDDRFILRNQTAQRTIGGGVVVHPFAGRHRRNEDDLLPRLERLRTAATASSIARALLDLEPAFAVSLDDLAQAAGLPLSSVREALGADPSIVAVPDLEKVVACSTAEKWDRLRATVVQALGAFHERAPRAPGMEMESLRSQVAPALSAKLFRALVDALAGARLLVREESLLRLPTHRVALRHGEEHIAARAEAVIAAGGVTPPDLKLVETQLGVPRPQLQAVLQQLEREGRVAKIAPELYFGREALEHARTLLRHHVEAHGEITAATFRDLLGASRKFSIALLDYFDRTGFTLRVGDVRKVRFSR
jgi:selenocysteine-specific elongation factor